MQGPQNPHSSPDAPKRSGRFSSGSYRRVSTEKTCNCRCHISKYRRSKRRNKTQKPTKPTFLLRPPESSKCVAFGLISLVQRAFSSQRHATGPRNPHSPSTGAVTEGPQNRRFPVADDRSFRSSGSIERRRGRKGRAVVENPADPRAPHSPAPRVQRFDHFVRLRPAEQRLQP